MTSPALLTEVPLLSSEHWPLITKPPVPAATVERSNALLASLLPVMLTVRLWLLEAMPSLAKTVKLSLWLTLTALIAVALGT